MELKQERHASCVDKSTFVLFFTNQCIYTFPSLFHIAYILRKIIVMKHSFTNSRKVQDSISVKFILISIGRKKSSFLILIDFLIHLVIHGFDSRLILHLDNERSGAYLLINLFNLL